MHTDDTDTATDNDNDNDNDTHPASASKSKLNNCKAALEKDDTDTETDAFAFPSLSILGICGSIGTGKSYACSLLTSKINSASESESVNTDGISSAYHIDTDSLAHGVYSPGSKAIDEIEEEFGSDVILMAEDDTRTVNRKNLGAIVFSDRSKMAKLEQIVWPHVKSLLLTKLKEIQALQNEKSPTSRGIVIVEAAVLLDADWDDSQLFDGIWIIRASSETSVERLVEKRGMDRQDALKRMEAQQSRRGIGNWRDELLQGAVTAVIENDYREGSDLWEKMRSCLEDPCCWKDSRCPPPVAE